MVQKYHSVKETADLLRTTPDEVRKLMEQRKLYGFRDGADWKFKSEDVEKLARQREMEAATAPDDADDVLLSEVELGQSGPGASGTVIGMEGEKKKTATESDLQLADGGAPAGGPKKAPAAKPAADAKASQFDELDLTLEDDLTLHDGAVGAAKGKTGDSAVDLSGKKLGEDELVLGGSGTGSDVTIGGDSGISLVDPADSGLSLEGPLDLGPGVEESLELGEEDAVPAAKAKSDDDFLLTPLEEAGDADDSESGSQVIALDTEGDEAATMIQPGTPGQPMRAMLEEEINLGPMPGLGAAMTGMGMGMAVPGQSLGMPAGAPVDMEAVLPEQPYTAWNLVFLIACSLMLVLCGIFIHDLLKNLGSSWNGTGAASSKLMDTVLGWFGQL